MKPLTLMREAAPNVSDGGTAPLALDTLAVHSGLGGRTGGTQPSVPPIVPSVGFLHATMQEADQSLGYVGGSVPADPDRYVYARHGGPNQSAFEEAVAALEGAEGAVSFSSGMAALAAAVTAASSPGANIVCARQVYGVTVSLLDYLSASMGMKVYYSDFLNLDETREAVERTRPACVLCEVLTNPLVRTVQLDAVAGIARSAGAVLVIDNTFTTPLLLRPLDFGAGLVVHSTTKYLNGHGDVLGGVAAGDTERMHAVYQQRRVLGAMPSAFDAWLALRGLRTLAVRMRQACHNAQTIAEWLQRRSGIRRVYYPGLPDDPCHDTAMRLFNGGRAGAVIAFEIDRLDRTGAFAFIERLRLIRPVTSLGDVYSLVLHPASSSHRALTPEQREAQGITEGLVRLSVGIEDPRDLIGDLDQALQGN